MRWSGLQRVALGNHAIYLERSLHSHGHAVSSKTPACLGTIEIESVVAQLLLIKLPHPSPEVATQEALDNEFLLQIPTTDESSNKQAGYSSLIEVEPPLSLAWGACLLMAHNAPERFKYS